MSARVEVALETSRREGSVALAVGPALTSDELGERAHASDLLPRLATLLAGAGLRAGGGPWPLDALFVGLGPGSYTGLRVGLATAQGLARACGALLYGLCSFEALAFAELSAGEEGSVVLDARAQRFYHARYRRTRDDVEVLEPPTALGAHELRTRCARDGTLLAHPGLAEAAGLQPGARWRSDARPSARALLVLGRARVARGALAPVHALEPMYLGAFGAARAGR